MEVKKDVPELTYRHRQGLACGIPLGGLGAGSVELRDDGRFHAWELFNNYLWSGNRDERPPEMWSEDAFFALRVRRQGGGPQVRLLHHEDRQTETVSPSHDQAFLYNYPFLRNIPAITYRGRHPFALLRYEDESLPVELSLEAFSPLIPHNARDSALPLAFFAFTVRNTGQAPCDASLMFSMRNCTGYDLEGLTLRHRHVRAEDGQMVVMSGEDMPADHRTAGSMAIGALGEGVSHLPAWTAGRGLVGFDVVSAPACSQLYYALRNEGALPGAEGEEWRREIARRHVEVDAGTLQSPEHKVGWCWRGALCRKATLAPGEQAEAVFLLAWFYPNHYHYGFPEQRLGHMYENWFAGAEQVARYGMEHFERLRDESRAFRDHLYRGSIDPYLAATLSAQLTTFPKSFWWTQDGEMSLWEGQACCQYLLGGRTVWSSWQPLALFPDLYTDMVRRMAEFRFEEGQEEANPLIGLKDRLRRERTRKRRHRFGGWYSERYQELGYSEDDFRRGDRGGGVRSALWGGCVEVLRDYMWTGDRDQLELCWPIVKGRLEAGIEADENGDGLPDGAISFITYDHWFLPATNCYKCSMWLGELQAGARLAELMGDDRTADRYRQVVERGAESFERLLWNGEYYDLCYDARLDANDSGCMADQVSGHLFARLCGLGPIHDEEHVREALRAVRRLNLVPEEGLLNGVDPDRRQDWRYFCRYSATGQDEALGGQWPTPWTGTEYYVAAVMAAEGLVEEALDVVRAVWERYAAAGMPYNHIECGEHYFRPLAAWALLPALQGLVWNAPEGRLAFRPRGRADDHDTLFILPCAWGRLRQRREEGRQTDEIAVERGELRLSTLELEVPWQPTEVTVTLAGQEIPTDWQWDARTLTVHLPERRHVQAAQAALVTASRS